MLVQEINVALPPRSISYSMNFDLDREHDRHVWLHLRVGSGYEPEVCFLMLRALRTHDTAIDVGANFGYFSLLMSRLVGAGGQVHAFEPAKDARESLHGNIALNQGVTNIQVSAAVVTDKSGQVEFFYSLDDAAGSCLWDPGIFPGNYKSAKNRHSEIVPCIKLDDAGIENARLLKIDTEGAEHVILRGAEQLLKRKSIPFIVLELNPHGLYQMGTDTEQLRAYMRQFGYSLFFLRPDGSLPTLVPDGTKIKYERDVVIKNALFSFTDVLSEAWPEAEK